MSAQQLAPINEAAEPNVLGIIASAARYPSVDVAKMQALLTMHQEITREQRKAEHHAALARVQAQIPAVRKDGTIEMGAKGRIKFAKFEDIQFLLKPLLSAEGFSTSYDEQVIEGGLKRVTVTLSRGGHSESCSTHVPLEDSGPGRNKAQGMLSANSYGKRRALVNMLDITMEGEDDDGAGGLEPITAGQALDIELGLEETGSDTERFLKHMGVDAIGKILTHDFKKAMNAIDTKRKARKAS